MRFTAQGLEIQHGKTATYRHPGSRTFVTLVELAAPFSGFPAGTRIGTVQSRQFTQGQRSQSNTFTDGCGIMGTDYDWLARQFREKQCGEEAARLARIARGMVYRVTRTFGYTSHEPCLYEEYNELQVTAADSEQVTTKVVRHRKPVSTVTWKRASFEALITCAAIVEESV
jgi:hypothetical protein